MYTPWGNADAYTHMGNANRKKGFFVTIFNAELRIDELVLIMG